MQPEFNVTVHVNLFSNGTPYYYFGGELTMAIPENKIAPVYINNQSQQKISYLK